MLRRFLALCILFAVPLCMRAEPRKIVILAGPKSHGPVGNGIHDYGWSARLLKIMVETSNIKEKVRVEVHLEGWPREPRTLEDADAIMVISDGRDGNQYAEAPHLASPERVRFMERQMKRGCGFLTFHFSTFAPNEYSKQMLDWTGGFFQWETDGKRQWYSAITTKESEVTLATPDHPVSRGLKPFSMKEEFYYNLRFASDDKHVKPIWVVPTLPGREPDGKVVAWARERPDGGRGFGTTCGHFYDNWKHPEFRTLILNALAWTARVDVPRDGVQARYFTHDEISQHLDPPIRVLLFAGNDAHKWHNWEKSTAAIKAALEKDPRIRVDVSHDIEDLGRRKLGDYQVIVQNNYANWHDPKPLSDASKKAFVDYLQQGGGLVLIHFANGAWHFSLPKAGESDWPEYRKIVRRVWNHNANPPSGHDAFGKFIVEPTRTKHAITEGLKPFEIADELYFRQDGTELIEPLITARSRVTKQDEPLAWVYAYGKGRIFQTLLGHSEKTYDAFEPCEMLRRAVAWCAGREVRPLKRDRDGTPNLNSPLVDGKVGKALDASKGGAFVPGRKEYREPPLTVECWAKLTGKPYHILVANELKSSATHWEIFAEAGTGVFTAYLPGYKPDHVRSNVDITDGDWHRVGMIYERERVRLLVDGKVVADQKVAFQNGKTVEGKLAIGSLVDKSIGCGGSVDEVRIRSGESEIGNWNFDALENGRFPDSSPLQNPALFESDAAAALPAVPGSPDKLDYAPAEANKYRVRLIDRSPSDAYCGVKVDSQGQIFVGGREALFVFEPDGQGGYRPRRELCYFHKDAIIIGIEYRGNDLYVLTCNALYLLSDACVKREGIKPRRLLWGLPLDLHVSFHCLAWGPEGDLYFNHGDPLLNYGDFSRPDHWGHWTYYVADGSKVPYTGTGAVLRIKPDGTNLKVVATGLRGPVGLCFDPDWNLFTNDNDHESIADRYGYWKLLHVTPGLDFGWPRGWMASKSPKRSDLLEPMISNTGRGVPVGLACLDDGSLIQSRWDSRSVHRYTLKRQGGTFTAEEKPFLIGQGIARPTGLAVGRDGRVFSTIHYLPGNVGSPHCVSDLIVMEPVDAPPLRPIDLTKLSASDLWGEMIEPSWERRAVAHQEVLRRGGPALDEAARRLKLAPGTDPILRHVTWLAATKGREAIGPLFVKSHPGFSNFRAHCIRALGLATTEQHTPWFVDGTEDQDAEFRVACLGLLTSRTPKPEAFLHRVNLGDRYSMQAAARILARVATVQDIEGLAKQGNNSAQILGIIIAGLRVTVPPTDFLPPQELPLTYTSGNAHFKLTFADAREPVDLRALARCGSFTTGEWWKVARNQDEPRKLKALLVSALDSQSEAVAHQAAYYLSLLRDDEIDRELQRREADHRVTELQGRNLEQVVSRAWVIGPIQTNGIRQKDDRFPEDGPIDLTADYGRVNARRQWFETDLKKAGLNLELRNNGPFAFMYFRLQSRRRQLAYFPDFATRIWHNGTLVPIVRNIGMHFELEPGSNDVLIQTTYVPEYVRFLVEEKLTIHLPDKLDGAELARRLRASAGASEKIAPEFLTVNWADEVRRGDAANGRRLFGTLACAKCHSVTNEQKSAGAPSLADVKKRFTLAHVVESVLLPSKQVAEPFRASRIDLKTGQTLTGLIVSEQADQIEVLLADATRRPISRKDIEERTVLNTSPMPAGVVKTPVELRDLLAYLFSDRPQPP